MSPRADTSAPADAIPAPTGTRHRAAEVAGLVADRLRSAERVAEAVARCPRPDGHPRWGAWSLLVGHPGIALLHATLSTRDPSWAAATHAHLAAGGGRTPALSPDALAGLVPAALLHHRAHGGYTRLLRAAGGTLAETCLARITAYRNRRERHGPGLAMGDYDVVAGLAGKGRLLLSLSRAGDQRCTEALAATLRYLVTLTEPVTVHGRTVPGWWCRPDGYLCTADRAHYPLGDFNTGLAHGIAGPLALLATAHRHGHRVHGMTDAIRRIADWLLRRRTSDEAGPTWPARIGYPEQTGTGPATNGRVRAAWCYGTAGVASALRLAGAALGDQELSAVAVSALRGVFARPWGRADLDGPTVCHGSAGLLLATVRVTEPDAAADPDPDPDLAGASDALAHRVLDDFDPDAPFGFRHRFETPAAGAWVDDPGLLQGAAGVALALATYAGQAGGPDPWDSVLLLS